jgi:8-oxo-dGTP pyrophosphatase MutT (NUDIX family)
MAASNVVTSQYSSENFVESCGAVLFDLSKPQLQVCLIHFPKKDEWFLAKGRRNIGEHRHEAALREVFEETGYRCHLHPVTMPTRATQAEEPADVPDEAREYHQLTEPFSLTIRAPDGGSGVKLI